MVTETNTADIGICSNYYQHGPALSDEGRKRLEDITLAAFHNLLIDVTNTVTKQLEINAHHVALLQNQAVIRIQEEITHQP